MGFSVSKKDNTEDILREVGRRKERFVTSGGLIAASEMKARAPVDTGRLRGSITTETGSEGDTVYSDTGPTANYAEYLEFGTVHQPAQPYAEPGWQAALPRIERIAAKDFEL